MSKYTLHESEVDYVKLFEQHLIRGAAHVYLGEQAIAEAVICFAGDKSGWTTGSLPAVDGGFML